MLQPARACKRSRNVCSRSCRHPRRSRREANASRENARHNPLFLRPLDWRRGIMSILHDPFVKAMLGTPFMQEFIADVRRRTRVQVLHEILQERLGSLTPAVRSGINRVDDEETYYRLLDHAVTCSSVQEFEECLR